MRKIFHAAAVVLSFVALTACNSTNNTLSPEEETISFNVIVRGRDTHIVIQNASGAVIETVSLGSGEIERHFENVPEDAFVTVLTRGSDEAFNYINDRYEIFERFDVETYPASYIADRTFTVSNGGDFDAYIYGACPNDANEYDNIVVRYGPYVSYASCYMVGEALEFSIFINLDDYEMQDDGTHSLILIHEDERGGADAYVPILDKKPKDLFHNNSTSGYSVAASDWKKDFSTYRAQIVLPEEFVPRITTQDTNFNYLDSYIGAERKGQTLDLTTGFYSYSLDNSTLMLEQPYISANGTSYVRNIGVAFRDEDNNISSGSYRTDSFNQLPNNEGLNFATDFPDLIESLSGSGNSFTYMFNGFEPRQIYAAIYRRDNANNTIHYRYLYSLESNALDGEVTFPDLPTNLSKFIPELEAGSSVYGYNAVDIYNIPTLGQEVSSYKYTWMNSYYYPDINEGRDRKSVV